MQFAWILSRYSSFPLTVLSRKQARKHACLGQLETKIPLGVRVRVCVPCDKLAACPECIPCLHPAGDRHQQAAATSLHTTVGG